MTHPTREELVEHLYGECSTPQKAVIDAHLRSCADCRTQRDAWRSTQSALDAWRLPPTAQRTPFMPWLRWAAAAVLLAGFGFFAGRTGASNSVAMQDTVRKEVAAQVAAALDLQRAALVKELRTNAGGSMGEEARRVLTAFAEQLDDRRQEDAEDFKAALQQLAARHSREVARLREDLSTVAVVADARLVDTQEQLLELANATPLNR